MKRVAAFIFYTVGTLAVVGMIVSGVEGIPFGGFEEWYGALISFAFAMAIWWIAAGIGIRLGVEPHEYFRFLGSYFGLTYDHALRPKMRQSETNDPDVHL
jgi:hypothetical protein